MTPATPHCPGATMPNSPRPLKRCSTGCVHYGWAATGMQPAMRQRADGTWHCQNERVRGAADHA